MSREVVAPASAARLSDFLTRGFASPPHDGFAFSEGVFLVRGAMQSACRGPKTRKSLRSIRATVDNAVSGLPGSPFCLSSDCGIWVSTHKSELGERFATPGLSPAKHERVGRVKQAA